MSRPRLAMLLIVMLAACARASRRPDGAGPHIELLSVTPNYRADGKAEFTLVISVDNAQPLPGTTKSAHWRMWLRNRRFAEGEQRVEQPLAPSGPTRFEMLLPLALRKAPAAADLTPTELTIQGELTVTIGGADRTLPFRRTLTIDAPIDRTGPDED